MASDDDINDEFESSLNEIFDIRDPDTPQQMLLLLDDKYQFQDLMWEVLHKVEKFDAGTYVDAYLDVLPHLHEMAPEWAARILKRFLNSPPFLKRMAKRLMVMPKSHVELIRRMSTDLAAENSAQFASSVNRLFSLL